MIFVDTGAWVARFSRRDQFHRRAIEGWDRLRASNERIVTSDSVFVETVSLLARKVGPAAAAEAGRFLHGWARLTTIRATREDESAALDLIAKFSDQSIGFVDCLSFAVMRRHRITSAFSYDRHFEIAGFSLFG